MMLDNLLNNILGRKRKTKYYKEDGTPLLIPIRLHDTSERIEVYFEEFKLLLEKAIKYMWLDRAKISASEFNPLIREEKVNNIADDFIISRYDPAKIGELLDGRLIIGDGHHRDAGLAKLGIPEILCYITPCNSEKEAASWQVNSNRKYKKNGKTLIDEIKARLSSNDPEHKAVELQALIDVLAKYAFVFSEDKKINCVKCLGAIEFLQHECEQDYRVNLVRLDQTFRILKTAYNGSTKSLTEWMIEMVAAFLGKHHDNPDYSEERLLDVLRYCTADILVMEARVRMIRNRAGKVFYIGADFLEDAYNDPTSIYGCESVTLGPVKVQL